MASTRHRTAACRFQRFRREGGTLGSMLRPAARAFRFGLVVAVFNVFQGNSWQHRALPGRSGFFSHPRHAGRFPLSIDPAALLRRQALETGRFPLPGLRVNFEHRKPREPGAFQKRCRHLQCLNHAVGEPTLGVRRQPAACRFSVKQSRPGSRAFQSLRF